MFQIDPLSRMPVYEQIITQAEQLVAREILKPGDPLPSVRSLSITVRINPNTIQKAYSELDRRELTISVAGKGCFVRKDISSFLFGLRTRQMARFEETVRQMISFGIPLSVVENSLHKLYANKEEA